MKRELPFWKSKHREIDKSLNPRLSSYLYLAKCNLLNSNRIKFYDSIIN